MGGLISEEEFSKEGDSLSPLLFIVVMLPLTLVLRKMKAGYKLATDMKPINDRLQLKLEHIIAEICTVGIYGNSPKNPRTLR